MAELKGGCQCGAVRYESTGDVLFAGHCQCTDCQKGGGGGHSSIFAVPKDGVAMTGETKVHEVTADSGNTVGRGFCPRCGGPIFTVSSGLPDVIMFKAGSLDDPEQFKPGMGTLHQERTWLGSGCRQGWLANLRSDAAHGLMVRTSGARESPGTLLVFLSNPSGPQA